TPVGKLLELADHRHLRRSAPAGILAFTLHAHRSGRRIPLDERGGPLVACRNGTDLHLHPTDEGVLVASLEQLRARKALHDLMRVYEKLPYPRGRRRHLEGFLDLESHRHLLWKGINCRRERRPWNGSGGSLPEACGCPRCTELTRRRPATASAPMPRGARLLLVGSTGGSSRRLAASRARDGNDGDRSPNPSRPDRRS